MGGRAAGRQGAACERAHTSGARGQVGRRGRGDMCVGQGSETTNGLPPSRP